MTIDFKIVTFFALSRDVLNTAKKESRDISYIELMVDRPASEKYRIDPDGRGVGRGEGEKEEGR